MINKAIDSLRYPLTLVTPPVFVALIALFMREHCQFTRLSTLSTTTRRAWEIIIRIVGRPTEPTAACYLYRLTQQSDGHFGRRRTRLRLTGDAHSTGRNGEDRHDSPIDHRRLQGIQSGAVKIGGNPKTLVHTVGLADGCADGSVPDNGNPSLSARAYGSAQDGAAHVAAFSSCFRSTISQFDLAIFRNQSTARIRALERTTRHDCRRHGRMNTHTDSRLVAVTAANRDHSRGAKNEIDHS